jgi:peptidyl-prolyl cis-trans isomerase A (cyclophilin A)
MTSITIILLVALALTVGIGCNMSSPEQGAGQKTPGWYAEFDTTMGKFVCQLFPDEAPKTVANFVGLAEGTKEFSDPASGSKLKKPFYDGLIFHRVIPNFMIQGGDPTGTGRGGPGYKFEDEFNAKLKFEKPGKLAMANAGPNTNGSQFFITTAATPWLDARHSIFGQVVEGQEIVDKISMTERNAQDRPLNDVIIKKIIITKIPAK